jgi:hypothetical protein
MSLAAIPSPAAPRATPLPEGWSLAVPDGFTARRADAAVVLWRDSLTIWLTAHPRVRPAGEVAPPPAEVAAGAGARDCALESEASGDLLRVAYRAKPSFDDDRAPSFHGEVIAPHTWLRMVATFETEAHADCVRTLWRSARPVPAAIA